MVHCQGPGMEVEGAGATTHWFWSPRVWLPPNVTWESFAQEQLVDDVLVLPGHYARSPESSHFSFLHWNLMLLIPCSRFWDLLYPLPLCLAMFVLRSLVERGVFKPLGLRLGIKNKKRRTPEENIILERAFRQASKPHGEEEVMALAKETQMTYVQVI